MLLEKLYDGLRDSILSEGKQKYLGENDVSLSSFFLNTINQKDINKVYKKIFSNEKSLVSKQANPDYMYEIDQLFNEGKIKKLDSFDKVGYYHISLKGIIEWEKNNNPNKFKNNLSSVLDTIVFPELKLNLKYTEKLYCIFFLILGCVSDKNKFSFLNEKMEKDSYNYLIEISRKLTDIEFFDSDIFKKDKNGNLTSKKLVSSKEILKMNDHLSKTGLFYINKAEKSYWLNLSNVARVRQFKKLIFGDNNWQIKYDVIQYVKVQAQMFSLKLDFTPPENDDFKNVITELEKDD